MALKPKGLSRKDIPARSPAQRARDWHAHLSDETNRSWRLGDGRTVRIANIAVSDNRIAFDVEMRVRGGKWRKVEDHVIVNPPVCHPDGGTDEAGEPTYETNIAAVLRGIVERHLP